MTYECEICKKIFSTKGNLAINKRVHTGVKPYECRMAFSHCTTLANHKRIHTGEKPFVVNLLKQKI